MDSEIRTICFYEMNEGFDSKFPESYQLRPEEEQGGYNNRNIVTVTLMMEMLV